MAKQKRKRGGRTTPKGTRPGHLRALPSRPEGYSPADEFIDRGAKDLLAQGDPLAAEVWASMLLSAFEQARAEALRTDVEVPVFEEAVLERCRERSDRESLVVAAAFASVAPPPHDGAARRVVDELRSSGVKEPAWVSGLGAATPTEAWVASDVFGDQDSLIIGFDGEQVNEHAFVALVDHNLSGQAKDVWVADSAASIAKEWEATRDPHLRVEKRPAGEALQMLRDAMAVSDLFNGDSDLRSEDFTTNRPLVWSRLRRIGLGDGLPESEDIPEGERDSLVGDFLASPDGAQARAAHPDVDVEVVAGYLVGLRCDYEGRPLRWSPIVAESILCDLAPRKLLLETEDAEALPDVLRAFVGFAASRTGLAPEFATETLEAIDAFEGEYRERMSDPASAGPAKAVLAMLRARGVDLSDIGAINEALGGGVPMRLPDPWPDAHRSPSDAHESVVAAAAAAPVVLRFDLLADFYGDGRKLTQKGHPTLADARSLVATLGTADRLDETIGDRTFKTRSAADLPELSFMLKWATAAGVLRKEHGKLRATAAWRKLDQKPVAKWLKAADALPSLGPLGAWYADHRYRSKDAPILDEIAGDILQMAAEEPLAYDEALDYACDFSDAHYEWRGWMADADHRRKSFGWELDRLCKILSVAGILERVDAAEVPDEWDPKRTNLVGGTLRLTPLGEWWLA